jgi:hypothetical protein
VAGDAVTADPTVAPDPTDPRALLASAASHLQGDPDELARGTLQATIAVGLLLERIADRLDQGLVRPPTFKQTVGEVSIELDLDTTQVESTKDYNVWYQPQPAQNADGTPTRYKPRAVPLTEDPAAESQRLGQEWARQRLAEVAVHNKAKLEADGLA